MERKLAGRNRGIFKGSNIYLLALSFKSKRPPGEIRKGVAAKPETGG